MIEKELLEKLGWSKTLIDEMDRVAIPLREQHIVNQDVGYSTDIFMAGNQLHATQQIAYASHSLNIATKLK